jgi:hypothetical protein
MIGNLITVFMSVLVLIESFVQRTEMGSASFLMLCGSIVGVLYLLSELLNFTLNFEQYKLQYLRNRRSKL